MKTARHKLDNGLNIVFHRDNSLPLVAVNLWYHVGSKNERPGLTGFAHLFEHMLFQGSKHVGTNDHFAYVQQVGGVANGSTWFDRTNYFETLPAHQLELGLWLESDRMGFLLPAMTEEKLENQRSVVMNERRQRVDNQPYGQASERLNELLYPEGHPYRWPVIGYMEDIEGASLEDVSTFFKTWYRPNNAVLTLAGAFEEPEALELVKRYFADLEPADRFPEPIHKGPPPEQDQAKRLITEDNVSLSRVYLAAVGPAYGQNEWYAGLMLAELLTGGRSSRLYEDLVYGRQMVQSVSAYILPTEECGTFQTVATVKPDVLHEDVETALQEHIAALGSEGPKDDELERAKRRVLTANLFQTQNIDRRADQLSEATTYFDDPDHVERELDIVRSVTPDQIQTFVKRFLQPQRCSTVVVVPRGSSEAAPS